MGTKDELKRLAMPTSIGKTEDLIGRLREYQKDEVRRNQEDFLKSLPEAVKSMLKIEAKDKDGEPAGMSPPMDWPEDEEYDRRTGYKEPKGGSGTPA